MLDEYDWGIGGLVDKTKLAAADIHGNEGSYAVLGPEDVTGTGTAKTPEVTYLRQNNANPSDPETRILLGLKDRSKVSLRIYDVARRLVRVFVEGEQPANPYPEVGEGKDSQGRLGTSGVYFYRLDAGSYRRPRKMVFVQ